MGKVAMADSTSRMNVGKVQKKGGIAKAGKKKFADSKAGVSFAAERSRRQSTARPKRNAGVPLFKGTERFAKGSIYPEVVVKMKDSAAKQVTKMATRSLSIYDRRQSTAVPRKMLPAYSFGSGSARFGKDSIYSNAVARFNLRPRPLK
eukprot:COSAG02_NODE_6380_length_3611_cov_2.359339_3_plen_148_part_00